MGLPEDRDASSQWYARYGAPVPQGVDLSRPSAAREIAAYFAGWELLEPGVVALSLWRPDEPMPYGAEGIPVSQTALVGGVGRR